MVFGWFSDDSRAITTPHARARCTRDCSDFQVREAPCPVSCLAWYWVRVGYVRHGRWNHTPSVHVLERTTFSSTGVVSHERHLLSIATNVRHGRWDSNRPCACWKERWTILDVLQYGGGVLMGHLLSIATKVRHGRWDHTPSVRVLERKILQYGGGVSSRHLLPIATKERSLIAGALIVDVSHRDKRKSLVWVSPSWCVSRVPCPFSLSLVEALVGTRYMYL